MMWYAVGKLDQSVVPIEKKNKYRVKLNLNTYNNKIMDDIINKINIEDNNIIINNKIKNNIPCYLPNIILNKYKKYIKPKIKIIPNNNMKL